jgi:hypothetical protein
MEQKIQEVVKGIQNSINEWRSYLKKQQVKDSDLIQYIKDLKKSNNQLVSYNDACAAKGVEYNANNIIVEETLRGVKDELETVRDLYKNLRGNVVAEMGQISKEEEEEEESIDESVSHTYNDINPPPENLGVVFPETVTNPMPMEQAQMVISQRRLNRVNYKPNGAIPSVTEMKEAPATLGTFIYIFSNVGLQQVDNRVNRLMNYKTGKPIRKKDFDYYINRFSSYSKMIDTSNGIEVKVPSKPS